MAAVIESTLYDAPQPGGVVVPGSTQQNSRDDLRLGYQVTLNSVQAATTYSWSLSFASNSPGTTVPGTPFDGTDSSSALLAPQGSTSRDALFNVDYEGTYLIRLVVDAGLPTEDTQFIRVRALTLFGELKLVAAGERRDEKGVIPVDATAEGWANDQNANFQRIGLLLRRVSHSGRILFVDSNRGRDISQDQDDYDNVIYIPGTEVARPEETGIKVRAMAHGDFSSINQAITYAAAAAARGEPVLSKTNPYFIVVRPGLYEEDLNLTSFVHIIGDEETFNDEVFGGISSGSKHSNVIVRSVNTAGTGTHRYNPSALHTAEECFLFNLFLSGTANTTQPVLDHQGGLLRLFGCTVEQSGNSVTQGEAYRCVVSNVLHIPVLYAEKSTFITEATTANRVAIRFDGISGFAHLFDCDVEAVSCQPILVNETLATLCEFHVRGGSLVTGLVGYIGYGSNQTFYDSTVIATAGGAAIEVSAFGGGAGAKTGNVAVEASNVTLDGLVSFETLAAAGTTTLITSDLTHRTAAAGTHIEFPDAPGDLPDTWNSRLDAETLRYHPQHGNPLAGPGAAASVNGANQLPKTNVQEAIDILVQAMFPAIGSPFYSLGTVYNGLTTLNPPTAGVGLGRTIAAVGGAVQVTGGTAPLGIDSHLKNGGIQAEGVVDIGGLINGGAGDTLVDVGHSEISLNPNMMGAGPFISLNRATWTNGILGGNRGFGGAVILADRGGAGSSANLHLRTAGARSSGTGILGNVYMVAGTVWDATSGTTPGDVHIVAGTTQVGGNPAGDIWMSPGVTAGGGHGVLWFTGEGAFVLSSLQADNAYAGAQAGTIFIGTPNGVEQFTFTGAENVAAAVAIFNATAQGFIAAVAPAGSITLYNDPSPAGDIVYVGDDVGGLLNTALGDFRAHLATFTPGTYGNKVSVDVPSNGTLRVNGGLTVTGALSAPTGYIQVTFAMSPYSALVADRVLGPQIVAADIDIVLDSTLLVAGDKVYIKDELGTAAVAQKIHITDTNAATFDGAAFFDIDSAYGAVIFIVNGAGNWSVF